MKLLVVDDEELIRNVIKEYALNEGFKVIEAENVHNAIEKVEPKLDGYSACKEIFKTKKIPTIMLSARKEEYDKLLGFELGIDDYVTKPFSPKELIARIKAVINRCNNNVKDDVYTYKGLEINYRAHTVKINNNIVKLTPKEYELLLFFVKNDGLALSREQLLSSIWGYDFYGDDRTVDTHVKMLRNNLKEYRDLIVTVRSLGYKYETNKE